MLLYQILKRVLDLLISIISLVILSPLLIPVIIVLKLTGEHEVFYLQKRVGLKNEIFRIIKFATMLKNSENIGTGSLTLRNDSRVTIVGKYLRITKINELPQIFNVLIGNMSVVGPRPLMQVSFENYSEEVKSKIYNVKPGITGIGSIIFRDEEKLISDSNLSPHEYAAKYIFPYKGTLELWYQSHASLLTDLKIIFLTAWVIIFPKSNLPYKVFKDLPEG